MKRIIFVLLSTFTSTYAMDDTDENITPHGSPHQLPVNGIPQPLMNQNFTPEKTQKCPGAPSRPKRGPIPQGGLHVIRNLNF